MNNVLSRLFGKKRDEPPMRDVAALSAHLAAPAVHVVSSSAPSLSHFGGSPRLPPNVSWPERDGARLGFLARLSLTDVQRTSSVTWLPTGGSLLFFYDMERQPWGFDPKDRGGSAVLLVPDLPEPVEQADDGPNGNVLPLPHRNVRFRQVDVLPSFERDPVQALELTDQESDEYFRIADAPFNGMPKHQMTGFPAPVQGDNMELECQLVSHGLYCGEPSGYKDPRVPALEPGAANWRLLLQLDTDDDLGVMWGDGGTIYYWVQEQEARAGNFANTWLVLQCS
jgi:uncharacterized protein YwqG